MAIWNILQPFGIFYDHLEYFTTIWYILPFVVIMYQEKSGNPAHQHEKVFYSLRCRDSQLERNMPTF
jgi:hypothetical protein